MTLRRQALVLGALALALLLAHVRFARLDTAPPLWDEALHLLAAVPLHDLAAHPSRRALEELREAWSFYPPLYHAAVGALFGVMGLTPAAARTVNLALLLLLGWGTHRAATALFGRPAGLLATALVVTFPMVSQLARMAVTDLGVAAFAAASVGFLLATDLRSRRDGWVLGLWLGAGLLTKWTFPAFVAGPLVAWAVTRARGADAGAWRRLLTAAAVAAAVAAPWYAANAPLILTRGRYLAGLGPSQGNPYGWNWANATVYAQVILDTFVAAPERLLLMAAAVAALVCLALGRPEKDRPALVLVLSWLLVPYVAMTAISNKDPRFVLPLVAPLAALCAWAVGALPHSRARPVVVGALFGYLAGVYALAMAPAPSRDRVLKRLAGMPRLEQAVRQDLRDLAPPPDPGWPSREIVEAIGRRLTPVASHASLEVVPDLSTVNPNTLTWLARQKGVRLVAHHPREVAELDPNACEYVLVKPEGDQGAAHTTQASAAITARVLAAEQAFLLVGDFVGPGGESLRLLRARASVPPANLRAETIELASPASRWHLGHGWSAPEAAGRWAMGRESTLRVELEAGQAYGLEAELSPLPGLPRPQAVTVSYRDRTLATWHPRDSAGSAFAAEIPAGLASGDIDELALAFAVSARPVDLGLSQDGRTLAVFVRRVRFRPR